MRVLRPGFNGIWRCESHPFPRIPGPKDILTWVEWVAYQCGARAIRTSPGPSPSSQDVFSQQEYRARDTTLSGRDRNKCVTSDMDTMVGPSDNVHRLTKVLSGQPPSGYTPPQPTYHHIHQIHRKIRCALKNKRPRTEIDAKNNKRSRGGQYVQHGSFYGPAQIMNGDTIDDDDGCKPDGGLSFSTYQRRSFGVIEDPQGELVYTTATPMEPEDIIRGQPF